MVGNGCRCRIGETLAPPSEACEMAELTRSRRASKYAYPALMEAAPFGPSPYSSFACRLTATSPEDGIETVCRRCSRTLCATRSAWRHYPRHHADCARQEGQCSVRGAQLRRPIRPYLLANVFDTMRQGESRRDRTSLGLGLYIARTIAQGHRGALTVASSESEGTTFTATLPRQGLAKTG